MDSDHFHRLKCGTKPVTRRGGSPGRVENQSDFVLDFLGDINEPRIRRSVYYTVPVVLVLSLYSLYALCLSRSTLDTLLTFVLTLIYRYTPSFNSFGSLCDLRFLPSLAHVLSCEDTTACYINR